MATSNKRSITTTREDLLDRIEGAQNDLQDSIDDLLSSVEDAVKEAEDEDMSIERLEEIYKSIREVADNQEQDLDS